MSHYDLSQEQKIDFDDWLRTASADDRHECARTWNWDGGFAPLRWVIEQPDCEKATAMVIFWDAEPTHYAGEYDSRASAPPHYHDVYDLLTAILERWRGGVYRNDSIRFDPKEVRASMRDVERFAGHKDLSIPESMVHPVGRRDANPSQQFDEGIPFSILGWDAQ